MQQVVQHVLVVRVRRRHRGSMRQPDPANHADVQLHIEVPLLALACLVDLRMTGLVRLLCRSRRSDNSRVNGHSLARFLPG